MGILNSLNAKKVERGTLLLWNGFVFHVRGFGCIQNQVLSSYGKSAHVKSGPFRVRLTKKSVILIVSLFLNGKEPTKNKTPAEQRDIFRPKLFYNYINLRPMHYKNAKKFEEKKALIHSSPF